MKTPGARLKIACLALAGCLGLGPEGHAGQEIEARAGSVEEEETMETRDRPWAVFEMEQLEGRLKETPGPWLEFLRVSSLSAGVYEVRAGGTDTQSPHDRDELYYVTRGRGEFFVDGKDMAVAPGAVLYVAAGVEHRFHSVTEDLTVLVFFAGSAE